jgi:hypothetical protein
MHYDRITWRDLQRMEDDAPPEPLSFTGEWIDEHFPQGMEPEDLEIMNLAMEKDMQNREHYWQRKDS